MKWLATLVALAALMTLPVGSVSASQCPPTGPHATMSQPHAGRTDIIAAECDHHGMRDGDRSAACAAACAVSAMLLPEPDPGLLIALPQRQSRHPVSVAGSGLAPAPDTRPPRA